MLAANNPVVTIAISVVALILGLPVAIAVLVFESAFVPNVILGSETINIGLGRTSTINFNLITGPNDAASAGAYISIIAVALIIPGVILIRHFTRHNIWGWLLFGPALANLLGQAACCAAAWILFNKYPEATSKAQVTYANGKWDTNGMLYSKEAWACTMQRFYEETESSWANKACSDFRSGRELTALLVAFATCLLGVAYWQVHQCGGFGWLFGRRDKIAAVYKSKGEYIDLRE